MYYGFIWSISYNKLQVKKSRRKGQASLESSIGQDPM